jgi:hypothetical protein
MLKDPTKARRPALGISCPSNCVEQETNTYNPPNEPVRAESRHTVKSPAD